MTAQTHNRTRTDAERSATGTLAAAFDLKKLAPDSTTIRIRPTGRYGNTIPIHRMPDGSLFLDPL